ncbi:MAG: FtsX-like permease family protein [Candidatus Omnitrophica bacterium]|nr:FtsX-like permease family protein [Candidatus Omnitrophota bacterium]
MTLRTLVLRELFERKNQLITSLMAILLGITVIVSIKNISYFSEKAVARELDALGANVLILPKSVTLQDYYSADMQSELLPEEYVTRIAMSSIEGVDNLSPKLSAPIELGGRKFLLTGILPLSEFQAKAAWAGAGVFNRPLGCGADVLGVGAEIADQSLVRKRVIQDLAPDDALVGADVASSLDLKEGDCIEVMGAKFKVLATLPQTGTVDDSRVFAHLHTVQDLTGKGPNINAIEIIGCCQQISAGMVQKLNALLPDAKVVTIAQIVDTQVKTNQMMARLSSVFIVIIILVGGASIANYMYANVYERRKEIGTLMALGAGSRVVLSIFLTKAMILGLVGGVGGFVLGTILAVGMGPRIAGIPVLPMPTLLFWAIAISCGIALAASYFPARRAAKLDPCASLQEV